jgi:hypothetical protein
VRVATRTVWVADDGAAAAMWDPPASLARVSGLLCVAGRVVSRVVGLRSGS